MLWWAHLLGAVFLRNREWWSLWDWRLPSHVNMILKGHCPFPCYEQKRQALQLLSQHSTYIWHNLPTKTCKPTIIQCSNSNYLHKHFCLVQSFSFCHQYPVFTDEPHPVLFIFCLFTYNALTSSSGFLESIMTFPVL